MRFVDRIWHGERAIDRVGRTALAPLSWMYAGASAARNALYDRGVLRAHQPEVPALSLGNLSVGGTGKTPIAAWVASELVARGAHPAVVLRGYGNDEPLVHERLNPGVAVVADADRLRGARTARARGADCVVLDDAFQHRRIARVADWVLVSAEQWRRGDALLPAGPLREPVHALRRATVVVVTRKTATLDHANALAELLSREVPGGALAVVRLAPVALVRVGATGGMPIVEVAGRRLVAVAAIGTPASFFAQMRAVGAEILPLAFHDHHQFVDADVRRIVRLADGCDGIVCTLKDAVKLEPLWRGVDAPLWYVSQVAAVERGGATLAASFAAVLAARAPTLLIAGSAGPSVPTHGHRSPSADR